MPPYFLILSLIIARVLKDYKLFMISILIATNNPHKQKKLKQIVKKYFRAKICRLPKIREVGESFQRVAEDKAKKYSKWFNGWAVATDAGARIPALKKWNTLRTHRFASGSDFKRMDFLLKMMKGKKNRTVYWDEALAVAYRGKLIFSTLASAMPARIQVSYNKTKYEPGHWLDSLCYFPKFKKNYFDLNKKQRHQVEDSWSILSKRFNQFFKKRLNLLSIEL